MSLSAILAAARPRDCGFAAVIPEDWHQGRTAYGGLSSALALSAATEVKSDLPPLRSAQISFVGPLHGEIELASRLLRSGRNATWIGVEAIRDGEVGLTASFVFMGPVQSELRLDQRPSPAGLIAPEDARSFVMREHSPAFLRNHFEARFALSRSEEKTPEFCWWVRAKDRNGLRPMAELLLIADALPPGVLPLLHPGVPVSSMSWQCNLLTPEPRTRDGWWLLRSTGEYAEQGCSSQIMEVWNAYGEPVAVGMQSVAVFG